MDEKQRREAATWMEGAVLVEAGAGTGKTRLLVDRVMHLVLREKIPLRRIVAITFTVKAAAEIRARLRARLAGALAAGPGEGERRLLEGALGEIDRAQVSTIHSFALTLLRERPIEAGLPPGAREVDPAAIEELRERMWADWLGERLAGEDPAIEDFLDTGLSLENLARLRDGLLELPEVREGFPRPAGASAAALKARILEAAAAWAERATCADPADRAFGQMRGVLAWAEGLDGGSLPALVRGLWARPGYDRRLGGAKAWGGKEAKAAFHAAYEEGVIPAWEEALEAAGHDLIAAAAGALGGFVEGFERRARAEGLVDFHDILFLAARLVRDHPAARRHFRRRYTHFLVDEFQDTDPLQAELLFLLAGEDERRRDWTKARFSRGRLFLVGDPKQSIYRFRRADIAVYHRARGIVRGNEKGRYLPIKVNFRSAPGVIGWVNAVFSRLIGEEGGEVQPGYLPLHPHRREAGARVLLLRDAAPPDPAGGKESAEARRRREAARLAARIREWVAEGGLEVPGEGGRPRPLRYGDVAVLFRAMKTPLPCFEEAFRRAGVPFLSLRGRGFYERIEVGAAISVLRALARPEDPLALAAALRSPLYGFSDEDLARWRLAARGGGTPPAEVAGAVEEIRAMHALRRTRSARAMLEEVFERTQAFELFLSTSEGEQRVANLLKLLDLAFEFGAGGGGGTDAFSAYLDRQAAGGGNEEGEASLAEEGGDAVQFLTFHSAKGLEFPVVVLGDLAGGGRGGPSEPDQVVRRHPEAQVHLAFGPKGRRLWTRGHRAAAEREEAFAEAEEVRLLYVACTRAREYLVLPAFHGDEPAGGWARLAAGGCWPPAMAEEVAPHVAIVEAPPGREGRGEDIFWIGDAAFEGEAPSPVAERLREREARLARLRAPAPGGPPLAASALAAWDAAPHPEEADMEAADEVEGEERYGVSAAEAAGREGGRAFGNLVHALLARLEPPVPGGIGGLEAKAAALARGFGFEGGEAGARAAEAVGLIRRAAGGELLRRAAAAPRRWRELPFFARIGGRLVRGFADLVFEEAGALVVVDFKTDAVDAAAAPERAARYAPQGAAYALGLEAAGAPVREVVFSFLRPGVEHAFAVDGPFRERALAAVREAGG